MPDEATLYRVLLMACFALAGVTFFATGVLTAPYGRHFRGGFGPTLPKRLGWALMESPSVIVFVLVFAAGSRAHEWIPRLFAALWLVHYVQRAWLDPLLMAGTTGKRMPVMVVVMGMSFNVLNSYLNARWLSELGQASWRWLVDLRFLYGVMLFVGGFLVNRWADAVLHRAASQPGRLRHPARRAVRGHLVPKLLRRARAVVRLGHRDVVARGPVVRGLQLRQPRAARGGWPTTRGTGNSSPTTRAGAAPSSRACSEAMGRTRSHRRGRHGLTRMSDPCDGAPDTCVTVSQDKARIAPGKKRLSRCDRLSLIQPACALQS
ncbi:MAG: hypothetical protein U0168_01675 [Nannocystaceae bacterium]